MVSAPGSIAPAPFPGCYSSGQFRMSLLPKWSQSLAPLVVADLRRRYAGSVLGGLWAFLSPLLEVAAYGIVFGWVLGAGRGPGMPYAILIASGLFPWLWFRETIEGCSTVLSDNRWVRRSRVPSELLVAPRSARVLTARPRWLDGGLRLRGDQRADDFSRNLGIAPRRSCAAGPRHVRPGPRHGAAHHAVPRFAGPPSFRA
jgi:hypothetical protein